MRKYVLLIGVVLMVALLVSANEKADAKTEDLKYDDYYLATKVKAIVENKKENSFKGEIKEDTPEAADWDLKKLYSYFTAYPNGVPATHFAGAYIENGALVIMLSCMEEECITALEEIGFKTEIVWKECAGSFFAKMEIVEKMNKAIYEINQRFLMSQCSEDEETLMSYYPCVRYDGKSNTITILFVTETEGLESAIHLFNKLIGEIPECQYRSCEKEEVLGFASTVNVYAGEGIGIQTTSTVISNYSIGFRVYYTSDGETHYGMVTAAHNNSVGNAVYLKPYAVVQDWIGYIDNRCIGGVDDEAFVEVTDIYNIRSHHDIVQQRTKQIHIIKTILPLFWMELIVPLGLVQPSINPVEQHG